jgi:hypothetical protein
VHWVGLNASEALRGRGKYVREEGERIMSKEGTIGRKETAFLKIRNRRQNVKF